MKKLTLATFVLALTMTLPAMAGGHDRGHDSGPRHAGADHFIGMKMLKGLDLTDAQKTQLKTLIAEHRATVKAKQQPAAMQSLHSELQVLLQAEQFDEAAARLLLEKQQSTRLEHDIERLKFQHQLMSVLTAEQKAKLQARQAKMQERMAAKRAERAEKAEQSGAEQ